tara:strand:- start:4407 stop:5078 length:672 start_codon:yes stop_codon:yes gene_type:complete
MKNISFLTLFLLCFTNSISSQSLSLEYDSYSYSSPGEVNEMKIYVTNETDQNLPIIVTKTVITDLDVVSTFCWGSTCYTPTTSVSTYSEVINAGSTSSAFTGYVHDMPTNAEVPVRFCFAVESDISDKVCAQVTFSSMSDVMSLGENILDFNIYPNPSSDFIKFSSSEIISSEIHIYDLLGNTLKVINNFDDRIDVTDLKSGIYILSTNIENNSVFKRFTISK